MVKEQLYTTLMVATTREGRVAIAMAEKAAADFVNPDVIVEMSALDALGVARQIVQAAGHALMSEAIQAGQDPPGPGDIIRAMDRAWPTKKTTLEEKGKGN